MSEQKIDQAFILAAGLGKRMRPLTDHTPKPLVKVAGKAIIDYALERLRAHGIRRCVINTHYLGNQIIDHVLSLNPPFEVAFSQEPDLLDTGGGLKKGLKLLDTDRPAFVVSGDSIWEDGPEETSLAQLERIWAGTDADILLSLQNVHDVADGIGDYDLVNDAPVRNRNQAGAYMWTSMRVLKPRLFDAMPDGPFSFLSMMDEAESKGTLAACVHQGIWHHLSTPDDVDTATNAITDKAA